MVNEEEFQEWLAHPVTKEVKQILAAKRQELRMMWESGSFTDYEKEGTILTNVANLGICRGYAFVEELNYPQYLLEREE
jgi:hypothetical protein